MAQLEVAADELVRKLNSVDHEVEEAREGVSDLRAQIEALDESLADDWEALAEAARALVDKAREELEELGGDAQEAAEAAAELEATAQGTLENGAAVLHAAEEGTRRFATAVSERAAEVAPSAEASAEALEALGAQTDRISADLAQVLRDARDFLNGDVVRALAAVEAAVSQRMGELRTALLDECAGAVQDACGTWVQRLGDLLDTVEESGFRAAHDQAPVGVSWALDEATSARDRELDDLGATVGVVQESLLALRSEGAAASKSSFEAEGRGPLGQGLSDVQSALVEMIDALDTCRRAMASQSFVSL